MGTSLLLLSAVVLQSRQRDPHGNSRELNSKKCIITFGVTFTVLFSLLVLTIIILAVQRCDCPSTDLGPSAGPACPDGWVGYQGKCYYFSEGEGNWASSQTMCSALNASLAVIDTRQDMDFTVRHKGRFDHWIGLRKDPGQPWKWVNGTEFNNWVPIGGGEGDCAYLNKQDGFSISQCTGVRYWICAKPDVFTKAKEAAVEEGL